jgi:spore maturation protein CgeB
LVNFYPDNPFVFWNGNSNTNVLRALPFYDYFLIWSEYLMPVLESAGCKQAYYFPFACDQDLFSVNDVDIEKHGGDVCFVGTWDAQREDWLTKLCNRMPDLDLAIFGNLWYEYVPKNSVLRKFLKGKAVYNQNMINIFRKTKIVLNFIRIQNFGAHNMRTMEVPASKAFLLTQRTEEQAEFLFKEGESIACFADIDELVSKIKFYLKHKEEREKITQRGFEQVQHYTMYKVLKRFLKNVERSDE